MQHRAEQGASWGVPAHPKTNATRVMFLEEEPDPLFQATLWLSFKVCGFGFVM